MKALAAVLCIVGCIHSQSELCGDGRVCPDGTVCDPAHPLCVIAPQLTACDGKMEGDPCTADTIDGHCQDGVCLAPVCGDLVVEIGEACDDGNRIDGDGCAASCMSNESCGNKIVDAIHGEECDDKNHVDHDGCSSTCKIEQPHWLPSLPTTGSRFQGMIAYDSKRDRVVAFGGRQSAHSGGILGDTWEWNGRWIQRAPTASPIPRAFATMAYDRAHEHVVLFGGQDGGSALFGDTWLWDGETWTAATGTSPPARYGATMAYDPKRDRVVLFGGTLFVGNTFLVDTWEWDGTTWTHAAPAHSPPGRAFALAGYDPVRGVIVMTGGQSPNPRTDTWTYDGDWHDVSATAGTPGLVMFTNLAFDVGSQRLIAYGGYSAGQTANTATMEWTGTAWSSLATGTFPSTRYGPTLASTSTGVILIGGADAAGGPDLNDTWMFAANNWSKPVDPGVRTDMGIAEDPEHARTLVFGGQNNVTQTNETWALTTAGFVKLASAGPSPRSGPAMTFDPIHHNAVLFGGVVAFTANAETWIWDGTSWTVRMVPGPSARIGAAMAFDGAHVTLFGGTPAVATGTIPFGDTWQWDGAAWHSVAGAGPSPRWTAAMCFDPIHHQVVLFGGSPTGDGSGAVEDTWLFDGTTWTQAPDGLHPGARRDARLVWNPARERVTLVGGEGTFLDAWEWDGAHWAPIGTGATPVGRYGHAAMASPDGNGIAIYGGFATTVGSVLGDVQLLQWEGPRPSERCDALDLDGDMLKGCSDPDCWSVCAPDCPPDTTCDPAAPHCGDGVCDPLRESCRTCPADCTCAIVCGDGFCDSGETCPGDCP